MYRRVAFALLFVVMNTALVLAGNDAPTPESNKAAIDLVQSHADYV